MNTGVELAIIGACGSLGEALRESLNQRTFPVENLHLLDVGEGVGERLPFRDRRLPVTAAGEFDYSRVAIVFFAGDAELVSFGHEAVAAGCTVIDVSGVLAREDDPLVVAEVNPEALESLIGGGVVATPSPSTVTLAIALKPLRDAAGLTRVDVVSLRAVSAFGKAGIEELASQTAKLLNAMPVETGVFSQQIAFNVLPNVGPIEADGFTREEQRLMHELRRVLDVPELEVNPTTIQVPVFFGFCEVVHAVTREAVEPEAATYLWSRSEGVRLSDAPGALPPTPVTGAIEDDNVLVGRVREDPGSGPGLNFWLVADNIRRSAAGNGVRIAEILVQRQL